METTKRDLVVVIMAGGAGTRFWPLSTDDKPKQFLKLFGDNRSLLQKSYDRVAGLVPDDHVLVLTNKAFMDIAAEQLPEIPSENIIGEPMRRDTAAAVCLGAALCKERFGNPVIATVTADHVIAPIGQFRRTLLSAVDAARENDALYTLGIQPTYPATGYGYLELGRKTRKDAAIEHFELLSFKEKPDLETAERYVKSGRYRWNSGMFVWKADAILKEIERHIFSHLEAICDAARYDCTPQWPEALERAFASLDTISIDYAVMEKAQGVRCVDCTFSWSDVGGWNAMKDYIPGDKSGNHLRGRVKSMDSNGNLVFCEDDDEAVLLVGVKDLVVVRTEGRTLIAHKDRTEDVKKLIQED
jgi:mannose-1-phosphate guanylyltransferase